ncbi:MULTISPECIES: Gfo/Idh/MocA family protein [Cyanophyceae]|uniref:Gfo/Idh/MocA family oxidoreductase n=1 Tax=Leptolyngbya subtilissima DQ-A4 TaxID=2933933 RepID=A0ABV0K4G3_9CYAN|nr:Gfo/Idh/MocA family oxidoreductase [Nodosilinea sp. FACHB-141]MBD2113410.1 Gfo/Idh/MocA family oxidoreductase [Nodosilinea sp. FACHB-141]
MSPPPQPLNLAIFGLGRWGNHLLRNFLALPTARVVAIVDPDRQRLEELRDRFALGNTVACYDDWPQAMAHPGLEAVVIATPASTHYPMIQAALKAGLHVLSEKPLTLDSNRSAALCQLATTQQRQLMIDHTYLFHPAVQRGRELCQQIGPLRYGYAARTNLGPVRSDADVFWDLAIHDVSILNYWLGQSPLAVAAWGSVWLQTKTEAKLRDVGWLRLTYPNPIGSAPLEVMVHVSWANPDRQRRLALVGDRGTLVFDESPQAHPLTLYSGHFQSQEPPFVPSSLKAEAVAIAPLEPLQQMCAHFLDCVANNRPSPISAGPMATELVRLMEAIAIAAETGQQVDI